MAEWCRNEFKYNSLVNRSGAVGLTDSGKLHPIRVVHMIVDDFTPMCHRHAPSAVHDSVRLVPQRLNNLAILYPGTWYEV